MDRELRDLERQSGPLPVQLRAHLRRGDDPLTAWRAAVEVDTPYDALVECARQLPPLRFVDQQEFVCGAYRAEVARFEHLGSGLVLCLLPGGRFTMGLPAGEAGALHQEQPQVEVTLRPFFLAQTVVTEAQHARLVGGDDTTSQLPAVRVSWETCRATCAAVGLRLPSEAEWEYGCRGGSPHMYCFGNEPGLLGDYAWYLENSDGEVHPVAQRNPNAYGLYDMHGNVDEWCQDAYHPNHTGADPRGAPREEGDERVQRGCAFSDSERLCTSVYRLGHSPDARHRDAGYRPAWG